MIEFVWNGVDFNITDLGGGALGDDIPRHAHSKNSYELHFILDGEGELLTDTKRYALKSGDFFITGPGIYHAQTAKRSRPVKDVFIMLQAVNCDRANTISSVFLANHFCFCSKFDNRSAVEILDEYKGKKADYKTVVAALTMKILTDITRMFLPNSFNESLFEETLNDRRFVIIEQFFLYSRKLTLTELSRRIGLCERQTQRLLKKYYGKSFREKKQECSSYYVGEV